jgi:cytochrome c-type biogenesis protein CcmH
VTKAALLALVLCLALGGTALAQAPKVEQYDVEDEVMCVSCNVPLFIAESPQADRQRVFIRSLIDEGLTKKQIKARLVSEYGEDVLAMPEDNGTGLAVKLVPVLAVLALVAGLALLIPRWRRRPPGGPGTVAATPGTTASAAELERLDADLKRFG